MIAARRQTRITDFKYWSAAADEAPMAALCAASGYARQGYGSCLEVVCVGHHTGNSLNVYSLHNVENVYRLNHSYGTMSMGHCH